MTTLDQDVNELLKKYALNGDEQARTICAERGIDLSLPKRISFDLNVPYMEHDGHFDSVNEALGYVSWPVLDGITEALENSSRRFSVTYDTTSNKITSMTLVTEEVEND